MPGSCPAPTTPRGSGSKRHLEDEGPPTPPKVPARFQTVSMLKGAASFAKLGMTPEAAAIVDGLVWTCGLTSLSLPRGSSTEAPEYRDG